jgi:hypothetical protein
MLPRFLFKPSIAEILVPSILLLLLLLSSTGNVWSQGLENERWKIGPIADACPSIWPLASRTDWESPSDTTHWYGASHIGIRAFASAQHSPNVRAFGNATARSFAEGLGWKTGMELAGHYKRFTWSGMLDHWRLSNVSESDWNKAWQWATWDWLVLESKPERCCDCSGNRSCDCHNLSFHSDRSWPGPTSLGQRMEIPLVGSASCFTSIR